MATMILIAGAMHGAWIWDRVTPLLQRAGHDVIALDLPGMGTNRTVAKADVTLRLWADYVADKVLQAARPARPIILAGHSRGGLVIGEAAERVAEHIRGLIYVTALIVPPGETALSAIKYEDDPNAATVRSDAAAAAFTAEQAKAMFYNCCSQQDASWAAAQLEAEPAAPIITRSEVSWERWGRLPRAFIECTRDQTVNMERQKLLQAAAPCDPVVRLDTDHSPFLSAPAELAEAMLGITRIWNA
jgi:pimeloyl-ACP methyl ester carboxylesterase